MTWDPYDRPHAPSESHHRPLPDRPPVSGRTVAAVLAGMVLLALLFTIAAQAQDAQTQDTQTQTGEAVTEQQEQQTGDTSSMEAATDSQPAQEETAAVPLDGQIVEQPEGTYAASELIGQSVISAEGENMGKIADLLVAEDNRIAGVMIGVGGFLGFGQKHIAVELDQLARAPTGEGDEQLMLNYTRAELEQAPEFVSLAEQLQRQEAEQARQQQEQDAGLGGEQPPASEGQSGALTQ